MEFVVLGIFTINLLACIVFGYSILYALLFGYCLFFIYGLLKKISAAEIIKLSWNGIKTVKNIIFTLTLIGMITALWRDCGTIPFIIFHSSKLIIPSIFVLITFLLCCLISFLVGTAFGSAATLGVICMTIARAMGIDYVLVGGAVLSGTYFGDRCSFMSSSAILVSELTKTDIFINIKNMMKTSVVPFILTCILYFLLGLTQHSADFSGEIWNIFRDNFNLHIIVILPALLIVVLCALRIKVKTAIISSIAAGSVISFFIQHTPVIEIVKLMLLGFTSEDTQLAAMMNGGGVSSMVRVMAIVCISSSYAGIFEKTGLLNGIKSRVVWLSNKKNVYAGIFASSVLTSVIACSQALAIILTHYLCKDLSKNKEQFAVDLENTVVLIAPLVPWSVASAAALGAAGAPTRSILFAFYLMVLPLWNFVWQSFRKTN